MSLQILSNFFTVEEGFVESYVDFFYITNNCMQDFISGTNAPFSVNSRLEFAFDSSEDNLNHLKDCLIRAEEVSVLELELALSWEVAGLWWVLEDLGDVRAFTGLFGECLFL